MVPMAYRSPDGELVLLVSPEEQVTIGFQGCEWHTHGDVLATIYSLPGTEDLTGEAAAQRFVEHVLDSRSVIAVLRVHGCVKDVWITEDIEAELRYAQPGEEIVFRYWDGTLARGPAC